eukprot:CAMPEP_0195040744 /NCGR_PEP_ID=MMETSP0326_2-20130528/80500_1 /TAXON_ID=2866 ORGANISM="Crypthecodinium cohnii, Strain Seligo" /NCGR_SAMPLE_ID=MMETSP0326_2 /ASSEMBLY_ACC=CAM_ASM_000348 /LENGTH=126 /DNA_ID=CAMNT_0040067689 /DNA_START=571 /DNA_END=951 /DNA_ORIENTATION=-
MICAAGLDLCVCAHLGWRHLAVYLFEEFSSFTPSLTANFTSTETRQSCLSFLTSSLPSTVLSSPPPVHPFLQTARAATPAVATAAAWPRNRWEATQRAAAAAVGATRPEINHRPNHQKRNGFAREA